MKKITLLFTAIIFSVNVFSQITFQKTYGGPVGDNGSCIKQTTDGGYIIVASTDNLPAGNGDILLIKTDEYGDTLWTKIYDQLNNDEFPNEIQQTSDGGYIVISNIINGILLIKTDGNGDSLWTKTFGGNVYGSGDVQQTNDGGYIIAGSYLNDVLLIKVDSTGNLLWGKTYGGTGLDFGVTARQTADGGYIVAGHTNSFGAGNMDFYLLKTNGSGDTLWTKTFGGINNDNLHSVHQTSDGGYIAAGEINNSGNYLAYLVKTDSSGSLLWSTAFGASSGGSSARSAEQTSDGGYIVTGLTYGDEFGLFKTDNIGNIVWAKNYGDGPTSQEYAYSGIQTADGGFIITGVTQDGFGGGFLGDIYLVKTDSMGNSGCNEGVGDSVQVAHTTISSGTTTIVSPAGAPASANIVIRIGCSVTTLCASVGIKETSGKKNIISLFPNPATNQISINSDASARINSIEIYNTLGEKVYTKAGTSYSNAETINITALSSGIYFLRLRGEKGEKAAKFIKQ